MSTMDENNVYMILLTFRKEGAVHIKPNSTFSKTPLMDRTHLRMNNFYQGRRNIFYKSLYFYVPSYRYCSPFRVFEMARESENGRERGRGWMGRMYCPEYEERSHSLEIPSTRVFPEERQYAPLLLQPLGERLLAIPFRLPREATLLATH